MEPLAIGLVDDKPERAFGVMLDHVNHRLGKARVFHFAAGYQQPAGEKVTGLGMGRKRESQK